jgi:hypothetical protein
MTNNLWDALNKARKKLPPPKPKYIVVHIDDLVPLARLLRKDGYTLQRKGKGAVWHVMNGHMIVQELLIDRTRSIKRGGIIVIEQPAPFNPEIKVDINLAPSDIMWRYGFATLKMKVVDGALKSHMQSMMDDIDRIIREGITRTPGANEIDEAE